MAATAPASAPVAEPGRSEADLGRDAGRRPAEVLRFFGIQPGMQVLDMFAGGGYYTEICSEIWQHMALPEIRGHTDRFVLRFRRL